MKVYVINNETPIGRFSDVASANAALKQCGPDGFRCTSAAILESVCSEPGLRRIHAALAVLLDSPCIFGEVLADAANAYMKTDDVLRKRLKDKAVGAKLCWDALEAFKFSAPATVVEVKPDASSKGAGKYVVTGDYSKRRGTFRRTLDTLADFGATGATTDDIVARLDPYKRRDIASDLHRGKVLGFVQRIEQL